MRKINRNKLPIKVLNSVDSVILMTIDGQKLSAHPTYRFSDKEWNNIDSKDQQKFLIMKNKYFRAKKRKQKKS